MNGALHGHGGISKREGSAGVVFPPMRCFELAAEAHRNRYGSA